MKIKTLKWILMIGVSFVIFSFNNSNSAYAKNACNMQERCIAELGKMVRQLLVNRASVYAMLSQLTPSSLEGKRWDINDRINEGIPDGWGGNPTYNATTEKATLDHLVFAPNDPCRKYFPVIRAKRADNDSTEQSIDVPVVD